MRSVSLLVVLGAYLAQGLSLERRDLGSEDTADKFESDLIERDGEFFAAQHPLARPDDTFDEKKSVDLNLNTLHHAIDTVEPSTAQNPGSEDNHSGMHSILKRVPGFITVTQRFFTPIVITSTVLLSQPFTRQAGVFVTVTNEGAELQTVTSLVVIRQTITELVTRSAIGYRVTVPPAGATEEFFTLAELAETRGTTITVQRGQLVPFTVTVPGTETITEGLSIVTVTRTVSLTRTVLQTTFIAVSVRTIVLPYGCACPVPQITGSQRAPVPTSATASGYVRVPTNVTDSQ